MEEILFDVSDAIEHPEVLGAKAGSALVSAYEDPLALIPNPIEIMNDIWDFIWESDDETFFSGSSKAIVSIVGGAIVAKSISSHYSRCEVDISDGKGIGERANLSTAGIIKSNTLPRSNKLALGLSDYLDEFAKTNDAHTWKDFSDPTNWKAGVNDALFNQDMQIVVNLDGIDNPMLAVHRAASNMGGATDWELLQIKLTPSAWDRITWYRNGEVVPNPFE